MSNPSFVIFRNMDNLLKYRQQRMWNSVKGFHVDQTFVNSWFKTGNLYSKQIDVVNASAIKAVTLSFDENYFVAGSWLNENVYTWSIGNIFGSEKNELKPTSICNVDHDDDQFASISCIAISTDNCRIYTGNNDGLISGSCSTVRIHDVPR